MFKRYMPTRTQYVGSNDMPSSIRETETGMPTSRLHPRFMFVYNMYERYIHTVSENLNCILYMMTRH